MLLPKELMEKVVKLEDCENCGSKYSPKNRKRRMRHENKECPKRMTWRLNNAPA